MRDPLQLSYLWGYIIHGEPLQVSTQVFKSAVLVSCHRHVTGEVDFAHEKVIFFFLYGLKGRRCQHFLADEGSIHLSETLSKGAGY